MTSSSRSLGQSRDEKSVEPEEAHHGLNTTGLFRVAADSFKPILRASDAKHGSKVTACREADHGNAIGTNAILLGIGPQPAHRGFTILELCRKARRRN